MSLNDHNLVTDTYYGLPLMVMPTISGEASVAILMNLQCRVSYK